MKVHYLEKLFRLKRIKQEIEKLFIKTLLCKKENSKCQLLLKKG